MIRGSCLCGAVAYEADALSAPIGNCHCRTCQKAHSAAFATTARVMRADFRWIRGDDARGAYESSPGKLRHFCARCGSQLMAEWVTDDQVILRIGSVDEGLEGQRPVRHIWVSHQAPWDLGPNDPLPRYPEGPPPAR
ncbi:MAG: GFA family protein [Caulobacterales bacterium]